MSTVGAEQRLPPEVHQARRDATIAGIDKGLTWARIAATLHMTESGYRRWLDRHARDLATGRSAWDVESDRRRAAVIAGDKAGKRRADVAVELGLGVTTLQDWARRHIGPEPRKVKPGPKPGPKPSPRPKPAELRSMRVRVGWTARGWTIGCPRCQRWFVRASRRGADRFAVLHARCCSGGRE